MAVTVVRRVSAPLLLGVVLAAGVCYPFADGRLLLLDFVSGPHQPLLPPEAFGLDDALTGGVPFALGCALLDHLLGRAGSVVPAVIFFPLATTGAARLLRTAALPARLGAGLLYTVNPFVFDRLYAGQLGVLLGYALLPFAVDALLDAAQRPHRVARAAGWSAAAVMMSEHFAWILVPVTAGILLTRPRRGRASLRLAGAALGAAAISSYLLVAPVLAGTSPAGPLAQLAAYRTQPDSDWVCWRTSPGCTASSARGRPSRRTSSPAGPPCSRRCCWSSRSATRRCCATRPAGATGWLSSPRASPGTSSPSATRARPAACSGSPTSMFPASS